MKSSWLLQNMVLNTHRVDGLGYNYHRCVYVLDATNYEDFFLHNYDTIARRECDHKNYILPYRLFAC